MAINRAGLKINHVCNICKITDENYNGVWHLDHIKGVGFKCATCYSSVYEAMRDPNKHAPIEQAKKHNPKNAGRIALYDTMQNIAQYLCQSDENIDEFHTVASIANALNLNYNTTLRAINTLNTINQTFFRNYDLYVKKLKTTSKSNRDKTQAITITRRKDGDNKK
jgi:hypothetical protein